MSSRRREALPPLPSSFEGFAVGIKAIHDRNGNSRRGWLFYTLARLQVELVAFVREDAAGSQPVRLAYPHVHFTNDFLPVAASTFLHDYKRFKRDLPPRTTRLVHVGVDMGAGPDRTAVTVVSPEGAR